MVEDYPIEEVERTKRRAWILRYAKKGGICAEFGVFRGHFSEVIAETLSPSVLYLIDPWRKGGVAYDDWGNHPFVLKMTRNNTLTTKEAMEETAARVKRFGDSVILYEDWLNAFCEKFPSFSSRPLDFAYLDTSHTYENTLMELEQLSTILAPDGVICGDDWEPDPNHQHHGVFRAVHEFVKAHDYKIVATGADSQYCIRPAVSRTSFERLRRFLARMYQAFLRR
jgi:hypothetical protein